MRGLSHQRIAELAESFLAADFRWELDGQWRNLRVGEQAPDLDMAYLQAARFGMLSAANPAQNMRSDIDNRSADHALQRALDQHGLRYRAAFVAAANRGWKAYNWLLIDPPVEVFDRLSREFGQVGTLLWPRGGQVRLRMNALAPPELVGAPYIDWIGEADDTSVTRTEAKPSSSP